MSTTKQQEEDENPNTVATREAMQATANMPVEFIKPGMRHPMGNEILSLGEALAIFHDQIGDPLKFKITNADSCLEDDGTLKGVPVIQAEQGGHVYTIDFSADVSSVGVNVAKLASNEEIAGMRTKKLNAIRKQQQRQNDTSKSVYEDKEGQTGGGGRVGRPAGSTTTSEAATSTSGKK